MRKINFIIIVLIFLLFTPLTNVYADNNNSNYTFNKEGNYNSEGYNILTIIQGALRIAGVGALIVGIVKFFTGFSNDNTPEYVAGLILMALSFISIFALEILKILKVIN